jgi:hypothetical protein
VDGHFLGYQVGLLDWKAPYDTPDVDLQVSLLTDSINHLYRVCVPVRWKFVPDPRYPWMTLKIRDAIRLRDQMRTGMMRSASAQFVERDFDPGLPQRVLWSNFFFRSWC